MNGGKSMGFTGVFPLISWSYGPLPIYVARDGVEGMPRVPLTLDASGFC